MSNETRERILRISREEFGGASADETVRRLVDEHWRAAAIAAVREYRENDPHGWSDYLAEADEWSGIEAPVADDRAHEPYVGTGPGVVRRLRSRARP